MKYDFVKCSKKASLKSIEKTIILNVICGCDPTPIVGVVRSRPKLHKDSQRAVTHTTQQLRQILHPQHVESTLNFS